MNELRETPARRVRVSYFPFANPPRWEAFLEPPGSKTCLYWAGSLPEMMDLLDAYFKGTGSEKIQRVPSHLVKFVRKVSNGVAW